MLVLVIDAQLVSYVIYDKRFTAAKHDSWLINIEKNQYTVTECSKI